MCLTPVKTKNGVYACGKCVECRLQYTNDWTIRLKNELKLHTKACFITLTYNPENLPPKGSLRKSDFQKFMKRLRKLYPTSAIRYYACGEYGKKGKRPHYHAILFGVDFSDKYYFFTDKKKSILYRSPTLEKLWTFGFSTIGAVDNESLKYCTKYLTPLGEEYYKGIEQPFTTMSRKPGIGFINIPDSVFKEFAVYVDGKRYRAPKSYLRKIFELRPELKKRFELMNLSFVQSYLRSISSDKIEYVEMVDITNPRKFILDCKPKKGFWLDLPDKGLKYFPTEEEVRYNNIFEFQEKDKKIRLERRKEKYKRIFGKSLDKFFRPCYNLRK